MEVLQTQFGTVGVILIIAVISILAALAFTVVWDDYNKRTKLPMASYRRRATDRQGPKRETRHH